MSASKPRCSPAVRVRQYGPDILKSDKANKKLICILCGMELDTKKNHIDQHLGTQKHRLNAGISTTRQRLNFDASNTRETFEKDLSLMFTSANIPFNILNNPLVKRFFQIYLRVSLKIN